MRVLSTQMGLVMSWVAMPAPSEAAKKSAAVSLCPSPCWAVGGDALTWAMARSKRDLKKKKEAQLVALPIRLGVRPR
jgi:hypothetical protein